MEASRHYQLAQGVAYEILDGEAVVLHLDSGTYLRLNEVATRAWEAIATGGTPQRAAAGILADFEVEPSKLSADLDDLVGDLLARSLIIASPSPPSP